MGCDIHPHFEIKVDGKWLHYSKPLVERDYKLFGKMAGVRNEYIDTIVESKGLPDNLSKVTELDHSTRGSEVHDESWFNANEIEELFEFHRSISHESYMPEFNHWGFLFGHGWDGFKKYNDDYPDFIEDIRLVFWFDN